MTLRMIAAISLCARSAGQCLMLAAIAVVSLGILSSASAAVFVYTTSMDGASEDPPNVTPGTGTARVDYDDVAHTMRVQATFSDLIGTTSAAHIHAPTPVPFGMTAGVATETPSFTGFPLGVTGGSMDTTFDLTLASSWNAPFITANGGTPSTAEVAFKTFLDTGRAYFNIHTSFDGSGEIRGFMQLIPEPATAGLAAMGVFAMLVSARTRRRA